VSEVSKTRYILITTAAMLLMMAVVGIAMYAVSETGRINPGALIAISIPTGFILGQSLARKKS
jgi:uncharacterized membrane protein YfcA